LKLEDPWLGGEKTEKRRARDDKQESWVKKNFVVFSRQDLFR